MIFPKLTAMQEKSICMICNLVSFLKVSVGNSDISINFSWVITRFINPTSCIQECALSTDTAPTWKNSNFISFKIKFSYGQ